MAIENLDYDEFKQILRSNLTPAQAISNPQMLKGREGKLKQIERAFNSPGMHAFIYGDRGVGKTSLAQSAATLHQSSDNDFILVSCDQQADFFQLVRDILKRCMPTKEQFEIQKKSGKISLRYGLIGTELQKSIEYGTLPEISSINDAVSVFKYISHFHSREPVIIIDEFDQLSRDIDKKFFADLIKQISDQDIGIRLIFCGIGSSMDELIGTHLSTDRYLLPVELDRIPYDARWEILENVARKLSVELGKEERVRIAQLSDGFPSYIHLIGEVMFWAAYDDETVVKKIQIRHFHEGIKGATQRCHASLRIAYDQATQKYSDDYHEVLWAVADKPMLRRQVLEIYEESYIPIMKMRKERSTISKTNFYNKMRYLKDDRHGRILRNTGAGWYEFRENVIRGYVRLVAEKNGIKLGVDHLLADKKKVA